MAGPIAHLTYGFVHAAMYMHMSHLSFTFYHAWVYGMNSFFGPDAGPLMQFIFSSLGMPALGDTFMTMFHRLPVFLFIFSFAVAYLYQMTTRVTIREKDEMNQNTSGYLLFSFAGYDALLLRSSNLSYACTWLCVCAGCLSHFAIDYVFEDNGVTPEFLFVISTGYWIDRANIFESPSVIFMTGICCIALVCSFWWYGRRVNGMKDEEMDVVSFAKVMAIVALVYSCFLAYRRYMIVPRVAAVGEEADLGILMFIAIFIATPMLLLSISVDLSARRSAKQQTCNISAI